MNAVRKRRLIIILAILAGVGVAVSLALSALRQNINLFYTPSQIAAGDAPTNVRIRAGGLVEMGSLKRADDSLQSEFTVTDGTSQVRIQYHGMLPDLFREGQGIVALGTLNENGRLVADEVLAKHDENYTPPEVQQALDKANSAKPVATRGEESAQ
ncbi:cytochrome c maturation protein CcmE [Pseudomonas sp. Marseille-QA0892]